MESSLSVHSISSSELKRRLEHGLDIPTWFSFPDVVDELRRAHPPRSKQGFTIFLTGLSGAGNAYLVGEEAAGPCSTRFARHDVCRISNSGIASWSGAIRKAETPRAVDRDLGTDPRPRRHSGGRGRLGAGERSAGAGHDGKELALRQDRFRPI